MNRNSKVYEEIMSVAFFALDMRLNEVERMDRTNRRNVDRMRREVDRVYQVLASNGVYNETSVCIVDTIKHVLSQHKKQIHEETPVVLGVDRQDEMPRLVHLDDIVHRVSDVCSDEDGRTGGGEDDFDRLYDRIMKDGDISTYDDRIERLIDTINNDGRHDTPSFTGNTFDMLLHNHIYN